MKRIFLFLVIGFFLTSCGDSESIYITSINNNSSYEIIVWFSEDSTIICPSGKETIIEENSGSSMKKMNCSSPYLFKNNYAKIIVADETKFLTKDISDDNNWICNGEKDWDLIMVGSYYSKVTTTFDISDDDIKGVE